MSFERFDMYLQKVLQKYDNNNYNYSYDKELIKIMVENEIENWFHIFKKDYSMGIDIQQSGSIAKGTAIKGTSDIDLFVSIKDPKNITTIEEIHKELYKYLLKKFKQIREQNVSIGIKERYDIDVVPAKKVNTNDIERLNDHYLWSNKKQGRIQTNIQEHIDMVRFSNCKDIIMLLKIWSACNDVEFPSIFIELLCIQELGKYHSLSLSQKFFYMMSVIEDRIETIYIEDPSNSTNIISDDLTAKEKHSLKNLAINTISSNLEKYIW